MAKQPRDKLGQFASTGGSKGSRTFARVSDRQILTNIANSVSSGSNARAIRVAKRVAKAEGKSPEAVMREVFK